MAALQGEESDIALEWSYDQVADMWWCGVVDKAAADAWAVAEAWAATAATWYAHDDCGWHGGEESWPDAWAAASTSWEETANSCRHRRGLGSTLGCLR